MNNTVFGLILLVDNNNYLKKKYFENLSVDSNFVNAQSSYKVDKTCNVARRKPCPIYRPKLAVELYVHAWG